MRDQILEGQLALDTGLAKQPNRASIPAPSAAISRRCRSLRSSRERCRNSSARSRSSITTIPHIWLRLRPVLNDIRRELLGLRPMPLLGPFPEMFLRKLPVVHGYSPTLLPKPRDWSEALFVPGFWFLDDVTYTPPPALTDFLAAGPPPVYVGFGSMTGNDPERLTRIALEAVVSSGQRAVLLSGWAGLAAGDVPPNVLKLDSAPHGWLFPRMAAIVHHGGVGTTHEALRSDLLRRGEEISGQNAFGCYQCGRCSAGCPQNIEEGMDLGPTRVMRLLQLLSLIHI
mgnify:CR=1 FL=1